MYQDPPYISLVETLAEALDARDTYTAGHSLRVSEYACAIGRRLGLPDCALKNLRMASRLHDIGRQPIELEVSLVADDEALRGIEHADVLRDVFTAASVCALATSSSPDFAARETSEALNSRTWLAIADSRKNEQIIASSVPTAMKALRCRQVASAELSVTPTPVASG